MRAALPWRRELFWDSSWAAVECSWAWRDCSWAVRWSPLSWAEAAARWAWAALFVELSTRRSSLVFVMGVVLRSLGGVVLDAREELRGGVGGGGFDLFDLEGVAVAVLAEEDEPLVAIEVAEGDVGEEVVAQVGFGLLGEGYGLGADLRNSATITAGSGHRPEGRTASRAMSFAESRVPAMARTWGSFSAAPSFFSGSAGHCRHLVMASAHEVLEDDEVFDVFGDGPAVGACAGSSIGRG